MSELEKQFARQLESAGVPTPERELQFHPSRRWRFDFAWPVPMLALEIEGGHWAGGRHVRPTGFASDCEKYNAATLAGWSVLRVTGDMVGNGEALRLVQAAFVLPVGSHTVEETHVSE